MGYVVREEWHKHYTDGKNFRQLGDSERALLAEHTPVPDGGGRALDVGCGTGGLAVYLSSLGYLVDAVDFADSAIGRARAEHADVEGVRWLQLDIERDDPAELHQDGYDLITLRLAYPFLRDRSRVLHALGGRLRPGGALVVISPTAEHTPYHEGLDLAYRCWSAGYASPAGPGRGRLIRSGRSLVLRDSTSRSVENGRLRCPGKNRRSAGRVTGEDKRQAKRLVWISRPPLDGRYDLAHGIRSRQWRWPVERVRVTRPLAMTWVSATGSSYKHR
ncbi:class I SAM-dependent methyltransferase [Streptomyces atratus]|uniref:class I SAM-dependent methyltransferase n=1 Tax=Streptomyces atratus TaxID=1893 RepID=UPI003666BA49